MIVVFVDGDLDNEAKRQIIKRNVQRSLRNVGIISFVDEDELETRAILNRINNRNKVFLSHHNYEELADEVLITGNIVAFAYCEVPVDKKYIYYRGFFLNISSLNSEKTGKIDGDYIVRSYIFGNMAEEKVSGWGVINEMASYIDSYLHDEEIEPYNIPDFSKNLSKFLFEKGIRPTKGDGMVIVDGEVNIVPPELVERVKKLLG